jgi:hypothetical protein
MNKPQKEFYINKFLTFVSNYPSVSDLRDWNSKAKKWALVTYITLYMMKHPTQDTKWDLSDYSQSTIDLFNKVYGIGYPGVWGPAY